MLALDSEISEYQLISSLDDYWASCSCLSTEVSLALFQKHFLVMHALYQLQDEFALQGELLHVSSLNIYRERIASVSTATQVVDKGCGALKAYYSDWENFTTATTETIEDLLKDFWQRFHNPNQVTEALQALKLKAPVDWPIIQKQYRRLAAENHPDKGGKAEDFAELRNAYEVLKRYY